MIPRILGALGITWPLETAQRDLLEHATAETHRLRRERHAARFERDQAIEQRDRERERANALEVERVEWQNERRSLTAELVRLRGLHDRLLGHVRGAVDGLESIVSAAEAAAWSGSADSGQSVAHSGSFGGWVSVEDRLPENGIHVIGFVPSGKVALLTQSRVQAVMRFGAEWYTAERGHHLLHSPTHWTPLPGPPGRAGSGVAGEEGSADA